MSQEQTIENLTKELREVRVESVKMLLQMYVQGLAARKLSESIVDTLFVNN